MYPKLILRIQNNTPHLYLVKDENTETKMTLVDENLSALFPTIAKKLGIKDATSFDELLELANNSDETYFDASPEVNTDSLEFELTEVADKLIEEVSEMEDEYSNVELKDDLRNELNNNQKNDNFASILDILYKVIITKTLIAAHDLEIDKVYLQSPENLARFREKMAKELDNLGVEMFVE